MKSDMTVHKWETISSKVVFEAQHWFKVVLDAVKLPRGRVIDDYYRIETLEYVLIYAKSNDGRVLVEREYKHGLGSVTTTFPAGFIDKGETPIAAAKRELLEETGFHAQTWKSMGAFILDGTRYFGKAHLFTAENLEQIATPDGDDMEEIEVSFLTPNELVDGVAKGDICSLPAISIMAMATNPLFDKLIKVVEHIS